MTRTRRIRKRRGNPWNPKTSKAANKARWDADRAIRDAEMPARIREIAEIEAKNLPRKQGDALGCLQWTNFASGKVTRWVVRIGDRSDRITVDQPGNRPTHSSGWAEFLNRLRGFLAGRKAIF